MANCPNCGSTHIQLKKETNVSWGRAAAGWILFGAVGAVVGAITGEDRNANACLNCGTSWKAADLYNTLQKIEDLTGMVLDLSIKEHRVYLNDFMTNVVSCFEGIETADKEAEKLLKESKKDSISARESTGFDMAIVVGFLSFLIVCFTQFFILLLLLPPIGYIIGMLLGKRIKASFARNAEEKKQRAEKIKIQAREKYEQTLNDLIAKCPLN